MRSFTLFAAGLAVGLLGACSREEPAKPAAPAAQSPAPAETPAPRDFRNFSVESITRGAAIFQERCAECHGPMAQGHPDWQPGGRGKVVVAPPLNGTGETWRRSKQELIDIIKNGVRRNNIPVMPVWKGRLTEQDMEDTIMWFQALWPPEVYARWRKANAGNKQSS